MAANTADYSFFDFEQGIDMTNWNYSTFGYPTNLTQSIFGSTATFFESISNLDLPDVKFEINF